MFFLRKTVKWLKINYVVNHSATLKELKFKLIIMLRFFQRIRYFLSPNGATLWKFKLDDGTFLEIKKGTLKDVHFDEAIKDLK